MVLKHVLSVFYQSGILQKECSRPAVSGQRNATRYAGSLLLRFEEKESSQTAKICENRSGLGSKYPIAGVTGHITSQEFVETWDKGPDNFASNPPNAVLSIFHADSVSDIVVELKRPALAGGELTYAVDILDGEMPASGGPSVLFIDVIGRPLSPVSVAGMYRRDRRDDRRDRR